jgi:hypothetical protein
MDRYFKNSQFPICNSDIHLIGVAAMFIANKYEDVAQFNLETVVKKIGHNKFSADQIIAQELEILLALGFHIGVPTIKEFIDSYLSELKLVLPSDPMFGRLCTFLSKIACFNYTLMQLPASLIAASILSQALDLYQNINRIDMRSVLCTLE